MSKQTIPRPPQLLASLNLRNYTMRFKSLPLVTSGNENRRLAMDMPDFLTMYSIVVNATTSTSGNVRALIQAMKVRRIQLWNPPSSQLVGTTGTAITGFVGSGAMIRLGAPNANNVTPSGQSGRVFQEENLGSTEPGYLDVRPGKQDCIGNWFGGANSINLGFGVVDISDTNIGALTLTCQAGAVLDITFDAVLQSDPSSDTITDGFYTVAYTRTQAVGKIISFIGPYSYGTNQGWTCVIPYNPA